MPRPEPLGRPDPKPPIMRLRFFRNRLETRSAARSPSPPGRRQPRPSARRATPASSANAARHGRSARCRRAAADHGHDRRHRSRGSARAASARSCGSAIRRRSRRRRGPRPPRAADRHRTRRCRPARRRRPASPRPTSRPRPGRSSATMLGLVARQQIEHGGRRRRGCFQHQIVAVETELDAGGARRLEGLDRAHSRALQPGVPVFSGADWGGGFASAPSAPVRAIVFQRVGADGRSVAIAATVRIRGQPSAATAPRSRWPGWISAWARTMRTVRTVAPRHFLARQEMGWW